MKEKKTHEEETDERREEEKRSQREKNMHERNDVEETAPQANIFFFDWFFSLSFILSPPSNEYYHSVVHMKRPHEH